MNNNIYNKQFGPEIPVKLVLWILIIIGAPVLISYHKIDIPHLNSIFGRLLASGYLVIIISIIYEITQLRRITLYLDREVLTIRLELYFSKKKIMKLSLPLHIIKFAYHVSATIDEHGRYYSSLHDGDTEFWDVGSEALVFNQKKVINGIALIGKNFKYFVQLNNSIEISDMINQNLQNY